MQRGFGVTVAVQKREEDEEAPELGSLTPVGQTVNE